MTRLEEQELDDLLDDLDAIDANVTIGNPNRLRKKRERRVRDEGERELSSFERWVDERKGGSGRHRRDD